jgi:hypothetical protein
MVRLGKDNTPRFQQSSVLVRRQENCFLFFLNYPSRLRLIFAVIELAAQLAYSGYPYRCENIPWRSVHSVNSKTKAAYSFVDEALKPN